MSLALKPVEAFVHPDPTVQLLGKIPIRNLWYLLLYAWDLGQFKDRYTGEQEEAPRDLKELLIRLFVQVGQDAVRQGMHRDYVQKTEARSGVRGRILFGASLKQNRFHYAQAVCQFAEFQEDTLLNQIVKASLNWLLNTLQAERTPYAKNLRHQLLTLQGYFQNVSDIRLNPTGFKRVIVPRQNKTYTLWIKLCELLYWGQIPTEEAAHHSFLQIFKEQIVGHQLYEKFLKNYYASHLKHYQVRSESMNWPITSPSNFMPAMRTDISLIPRTEGFPKIIIDAKFYTQTLAQSHRGDLNRYRTGHLYQIYAYLRTQEEMYPSARGILLYPTVQAEHNEQLEMQGHQFQIATVNLASPWQEIEERLLTIVSM